MAAWSRMFSFLPDPLWRKTKSELFMGQGRPRGTVVVSAPDLSPSRNDDRDNYVQL